MYAVDGGRGVALTRQADHNNATEPSPSADGRYVFFTIDVQGVDDPAKGKTQLRRLDLVDRRRAPCHRRQRARRRRRRAGCRAAAHSRRGLRPTAGSSPSAAGSRPAPFRSRGKQLGPRTALWLRDMQTGAERLLVDPVERDLQQNASDWAGYLPGYAWNRDGTQIFIGQGGQLKRVDVALGQGRRDSFQGARPADDLADGLQSRWRSTISSQSRPSSCAGRMCRPTAERAVVQAVGALWTMDLARRIAEASPADIVRTASVRAGLVARRSIDRLHELDRRRARASLARRRGGRRAHTAHEGCRRVL